MPLASARLPEGKIAGEKTWRAAERASETERKKEREETGGGEIDARLNWRRLAGQPRDACQKENKCGRGELDAQIEIASGLLGSFQISQLVLFLSISQ